MTEGGNDGERERRRVRMTESRNDGGRELRKNEEARLGGGRRVTRMRTQRREFPG